MTRYYEENGRIYFDPPIEECFCENCETQFTQEESNIDDYEYEILDKYYVSFKHKRNCVEEYERVDDDCNETV